MTKKFSFSLPKNDHSGCSTGLTSSGQRSSTSALKKVLEIRVLGIEFLFVCGELPCLKESDGNWA